jgi:hypothetical protein
MGKPDWSTQHSLEKELQEFRKLGVKLDLLFNANCSGERAVSCSLKNEVRQKTLYPAQQRMPAVLSRTGFS